MYFLFCLSPAGPRVISLNLKPGLFEIDFAPIEARVSPQLFGLVRLFELRDLLGLGDSAHAGYRFLQKFARFRFLEELNFSESKFSLALSF